MTAAIAITKAILPAAEPSSNTGRSMASNSVSLPNPPTAITRPTSIAASIRAKNACIFHRAMARMTKITPTARARKGPATGAVVARVESIRSSRWGTGLKAKPTPGMGANVNANDAWRD